MEIEEYEKQVCRLNGRINETLAEAARLRREGRLAEWAVMEAKADRDIDALVDLKARLSRRRKEALV